MRKIKNGKKVLYSGTMGFWALGKRDNRVGRGLTEGEEIAKGGGEYKPKNNSEKRKKEQKTRSSMKTDRRGRGGLRAKIG